MSGGEGGEGEGEGVPQRPGVPNGAETTLSPARSLAGRGDAHPGRRFPRGAVLLALAGAVLLVGGVALLVLARMRPEGFEWTARLGRFAAPAILIGGAGLCVAVGAVAVDGAAGPRQRPAPAGSHRSVISTTLVAIIGALFVTVAYVVIVPGAGSQMTGAFVVAGLSLYGSLALMIYLRGVRSGLLNAQKLGLGMAWVRDGTAWGIGGALAILALAAVNGIVLQAVGADQPQIDAFRWLEDRSWDEFLLVGIGVAFVAPIVEELFFRGYVFNAYLTEKGAGAAYLGSSLIFGVVHGLPSLFVAIFGMGLVLAFLYRRTGTIIAPIVAHVVNNGVALVALLAGLQH